MFNFLGSLKVKRQRTSMTFERCVLKHACVSLCVSESTMCSFLFKLICRVPKMYIRVLLLEKFGKNFSRTNQRVVEADLTCRQKLSQDCRILSQCSRTTSRQLEWTRIG